MFARLLVPVPPEPTLSGELRIRLEIVVDPRVVVPVTSSEPCRSVAPLAVRLEVSIDEALRPALNAFVPVKVLLRLSVTKPAGSVGVFAAAPES